MTRSGSIVNRFVGRAPGWVRHTDVKRGHKIVGTGNGDERCAIANCDINQPCDTEFMKRFHKPNAESRRDD